jgi:biotin transporter BioY
VKILLGFLFLSFVLGALAHRRQRTQRFAIAIGLCLVVAVALSSQRWV